MLSPYTHITYDSHIYRDGVRWSINTSHNRVKNVRGLRTRHLERGIDLLMYMSKKYKNVFQVRLESHSDRYSPENNREWIKTRDNFVERAESKYGECKLVWGREWKDGEKPHYHIVAWFNGHNIASAKPLQQIWEDIHHKRDHSVPYDWSDSQFDQGVMHYGLPSQTTDRAFGWSYLCKVSTKGACTGGYDFDCSRLPKVKADVIELNREGSMHAV